eukprot:4990586-Amphidinium_carterae.1
MQFATTFATGGALANCCSFDGSDSNGKACINHGIVNVANHPVHLCQGVAKRASLERVFKNRG